MGRPHEEGEAEALGDALQPVAKRRRGQVLETIQVQDRVQVCEFLFLSVHKSCRRVFVLDVS